MKNFMNDKNTYVDESLAGLLRANSGSLCCDPQNKRAIYSVNSPVPGKVAIVTGGGYGHLPLFVGYIGKGLCDGCAVGNIFSPPSFDSVWSVTRHVSSDAGVLFLFGNYFNDSISFMLAAEMADLEGIPNATVKVCDDISSGDAKTSRRGIAGIYFAYKIAGACANEMNCLNYVRYIAQKTVANTSTYGVATTSCHLPSSPQPLFEMEKGELELGAGIHGEPGKNRTGIMTSKELVRLLLPEILKDQELIAGDVVAILINGLGGTAHEDLYIVYNDAVDFLNLKGIEVRGSYVGEYATSMETAGMSITILKLDAELERFLAAPAQSPFFPIGGI